MEFQADGAIVFEAPKPKGGSGLASVVAAFVPTWPTSIGFILVFILIRHRFPNIYAPRTFMGTIPERHRTPLSRRGLLDWFHTMRTLPDKFVLYHHGLEPYLFLRFLQTVMGICLAGCLLTWPILMPVNAAGGGSATEFDKISVGNVQETRFFYAHAVIACVFFGFILFTVARERLWIVGLRQAWFLAKPTAERLSSRTVLFLSAPDDALRESNRRTYFGDAAVRVWPVTKVEALEALVADRDAKVEQLEAAEMSLVRRTSKKAQCHHRKNSSSQRNGNNSNAETLPQYDDLPEEVRRASRPTHYPKKVPGVTRKVDTIDWLRDQIQALENEIEDMRATYEPGEPGGAAAVFVAYTTPAEAQRACQQVASADVFALSPRYANVAPGEVLWDNLALPHARRISQEGIASALIVATIVFWSIPSGFVGLVSNIGRLADTVEWLVFLKQLPDPIISGLSGLLPPLAASTLSSWVPKIFRYVIKTFGGPTTVVNELSVQKWYYVFQVVQVFLVTAVFSGGAAVASELLQRARDPTSIPELLAKQLPSASNYYLTYFIVQGTTSAADNLLNYSDLLEYQLFSRFVDNTPRDKFRRYTSMKGVQWGKVFPKFANFAIIAIAYSCIAPLVLGFAAAGLACYYISYRYNLLFVMQPKIDTKGQAYILALQHLLTGVYIGELALIGIFVLRKATGPAVIVGILLIATVLFNTLMNKYLKPLEEFLPTELASVVDGNEENESAPLLPADGESDALLGTSSASYIQQLGRRASLPPPLRRGLLGPLAQFFEPRIFASYEAMRVWLQQDGDDYDAVIEDAPEAYSEEDLAKAYRHPALTSSMPLVWLARDALGASRAEVRENEAQGLKASDNGAWLDARGRVQWSAEDFSQVPVWKEKVQY